MGGKHSTSSLGLSSKHVRCDRCHATWNHVGYTPKPLKPPSNMDISSISASSYPLPSSLSAPRSDNKQATAGTSSINVDPGISLMDCDITREFRRAPFFGRKPPPQPPSSHNNNATNFDDGTNGNSGSSSDVGPDEKDEEQQTDFFDTSISMTEQLLNVLNGYSPITGRRYHPSSPEFFNFVRHVNDLLARGADPNYNYCRFLDTLPPNY
jgi:hypothetical protein